MPFALRSANHILRIRSFPGITHLGFAVILFRNWRMKDMQQLIRELRQIADECESRAKRTADPESKADLVNLATNCHLLAGKAETRTARVDISA